MWYATIFSEGDLLNDDYLQKNQRVEKGEFGGYFETYDDTFANSWDVDERLKFIDSCIERLQAEKEHLQKYGYKLVRLGSYENLKD